MVLGRFIEQVSAECACKNDNSVFQHFLIISPYPYFNLFQEHNSATVRYISMILGAFIE